MNKWNELKEWNNKMFNQSANLTNPAGRLIHSFHKQIKDKMWSLERREEKSLSKLKPKVNKKVQHQEEIEMWKEAQSVLVKQLSEAKQEIKRMRKILDQYGSFEESKMTDIITKQQKEINHWKSNNLKQN